MGTLAYQEVYGINGAAAAKKAWAELHRLDALWSPYRPGNVVDTTRKSAGKEAVMVDQETLRVLLSAKEIGLMFGGDFDVTADTLVRLWRGVQPHVTNNRPVPKRLKPCSPCSS